MCFRGSSSSGDDRAVCRLAPGRTEPPGPCSCSAGGTGFPWASPPMGGLHDMRPMVSALIVRRRVEHPIRAAARAASHPACPPPTTTTSYSFGYSYTLTAFLLPCSTWNRDIKPFFFPLFSYAKGSEDGA